MSSFPEVAAQPKPPELKPAQYSMKFHGNGVDLAIIVLKNILLSVVTVGIYSFWGKVNVRKFLWHNSEFHGHRFGYHGTGKELLIGWAKFFGIFVGFNLLVAGALSISQGLGLAMQAGFGLLLLFLVPYAIYMSQRYLYSRTSWRGIRLGMMPDAIPFVKAFVGGYLLTIITLGFYAPVWQNRLYRIRMDHSRLGTLACRYTGADKEAFMLFLRSLPLIIVTLGIYGIWYQAKVSKWRSENTWLGSAQLGAARGQLTITGGAYFKLILINFFFLILTAGLAMPWIIAHNMSFFLGRFSFVGNIDFDKVVQVASGGSPTADGMADVLDVGFGV